LTQPVSETTKLTFPYDQYINSANRNYVEIGGSTAVVIRYDASDAELYETLGKVNGVLFTGGGLLLIDPTTGEQS
jgi:hypothetical protein